MPWIIAVSAPALVYPLYSAAGTGNSYSFTGRRLDDARRVWIALWNVYIMDISTVRLRVHRITHESLAIRNHFVHLDGTDVGIALFETACGSRLVHPRAMLFITASLVLPIAHISPMFVGSFQTHFADAPLGVHRHPLGGSRYLRRPVLCGSSEIRGYVSPASEQGVRDRRRIGSKVGIAGSVSTHHADEAPFDQILMRKGRFTAKRIAFDRGWVFRITRVSRNSRRKNMARPRLSWTTAQSRVRRLKSPGPEAEGKVERRAYLCVWRGVWVNVASVKSG